MKNVCQLALLMGLVLAFSLVTPVHAGGWAVVVLDALPTGIRAGETVEVGFTVLQHGRTPLGGLTPIVLARNDAGGEVIRVEASPEGTVGHYTAALLFPREGAWMWEIEAFGAAHEMPQLSVAAAAGTAAIQESATAPALYSSIAMPLIAAAGGLALGLALGRGNLRTRRWALVGIAAAVVAIGLLAVPRPAASEAVSEPALSDLQAYGRELFLAKGCVTCHVNDRAGTASRSVEFGPNLTVYRNSPEFLEAWLSDPNSVRPAKMPDLGLSDAEIAALIAFLNSG